jgi:hypothetical protein
MRTTIGIVVLAVAGAIASHGAAAQQLGAELTLYDQSQQQSGFVNARMRNVARSRLRLASDVDVTGSVGAPMAPAVYPLWQSREEIRRNAEDHQ